MPLTSKGQSILKAMENTYGSEKKAEQVLYASKNAGKITGIDDINYQLGMLTDAVTGLKSRLDSYCNRRADDHRVIGGVNLNPTPKGAADPNIAQ